MVIIYVSIDLEESQSNYKTLALSLVKPNTLNLLNTAFFQLSKLKTTV